MAESPDPSLATLSLDAQRLQSTLDLQGGGFIGQVFGDKYRILEEISRGGMGRVFRAEQLTLQRQVALKVILEGGDAQANRRFLLEAGLTAKLNHPNIVKVFDFGRTTDGILFMVMELLSGQTLADRVREQGPLELKQALRLTSQLCGALAESHSRNVIHRDIKPSNIIITERPGTGLSAKLIDFGLVKSVDESHGLSQTNSMMGTPMYMAPEQITASGVDDRVDIYALGLCLYFALTGEPPYPERGINALLHAQLNEEVKTQDRYFPRMGTDHLLQWILKHAVAKEPEQRFQNALQLLEALQVCEAHLDAENFPKLQLREGILEAHPEVEFSNPRLPHHPLVQSGSWTRDGSSLSRDYVDRMEDSLIGESAVVQGFATAPQVPAAPLPADPPRVLSQEGQRGRLILLGALALLALFALYTMRDDLRSAESPDRSQPAQVQIQLESDPSGADVYKQGKLVGSTPFTLVTQAEGSLQVELRLKGYGDRSVELSASTPKVLIRMSPSEEAPPEPEPDSEPSAEGAAAVPVTPSAPAAAAPALPPPPPSASPAEAPRDPFSSTGSSNSANGNSSPEAPASGPRNPWD